MDSTGTNRKEEKAWPIGRQEGGEEAGLEMNDAVDSQWKAEMDRRAERTTNKVTKGGGSLRQHQPMGRRGEMWHRPISGGAGCD